MTRRPFIILLIVLTAMVALSATSFPGAMLGLVVAFGVVIPAHVIGDVLTRGGGPGTGKAVLWVLVGLYAVLVLASIVRIWRLLRRRDLKEARVAGFLLALLVAVPLMGWLSLRAMIGAWP